MKSHWLLLFCLLFVVGGAFAQLPPFGLSGSVDENGAVSLSWGAPAQADYMEDFEDGVADDFAYDNAANWTVTGGQLQGTFTPSSAADQWEGACYHGAYFSHGTTEASVMRTMGTNGFSEGLFLNATGPYTGVAAGYDGYMVNIAGNGYYLVVKIVDDVQTFVTPAWVSTADLNQGNNVSNVVSVEQDGSNYTYFINGVQQMTWSDATLSMGFIGTGFAEDLGIQGQVQWDYLAQDNAIAAPMGTSPVRPSGEIANLDYVTHTPANLPAVQVRHKTLPNGILYADGHYVGANHNELDDLLGFNIYKDGNFLDMTTGTSYTDQLSGYGSFDYSVTALWDEGESTADGPVTISWLDPNAYILMEDFDAGMPGDWSVQSTIASGTWVWDNGSLPHSRGLFPTPYMLVDSDWAGPTPHLMERLLTPELDITGNNTVILTNDWYLNVYIAEDLFTQYSVDGGSTWNTIIDHNAAGQGSDSDDVSAMLAGQDAVTFSWYYDDNGNWGWYAGVDNVQVYYQGETGPVTLDLMPTNTSIPAGGGTVVYDAHLMSTIGASMNGLRYWTKVQFPNGQVFGPLMNVPFNLTPFMDVTVTGLTQSIPGNAPSGSYMFMGYAGVMNNPNLQISDHFGFTKAGAASGDNFVFDPAQWKAGGDVSALTGVANVELPTAYALHQAYPNPFNPTTTVAVALPEASNLTVTVFNVMGQKVGELVNGKVNAGVHNYVFDGSHLASGLYFIQAQVPGQLNAVQKVTLMK